MIAALLGNGWLVGTVTGVISGLIVTWISRAFLINRDDRIFQQRVEQANQEIIYAIRPSLSQGVMPTREIIEALIRSFGRKYRIATKNLVTIGDVCDDLTREIMDSDFIESERKLKLCDALGELGQVPTSATVESEIAKREVASTRARIFSLTSVYMGLVTGITTAVIGVLSFSKGAVESVADKRFLGLLIPLLVALIATVIMAIAMMWMREMMRQPRRVSLEKIRLVGRSEPDDSPT